MEVLSHALHLAEILSKIWKGRKVVLTHERLLEKLHFEYSLHLE